MIRRIDRTIVPPGGLEAMAESDARPSPGLAAAIERARVRRDRERAEHLACAWSDYRSAYGADSAAYKHFKAGWDAAHGTSHEPGALR